jgi:hypothetical protein
MTDDHAMGALPPTCKPDDPAGPPIVLLPPQAAISVEIANDGDVILRQECALGGDPDQIVIARANLSAFLEALIDLTPHGRGWFNLGEVPPEWSAEPEAASKYGADAAYGEAAATERPPVRSPAAERQARHRQRKRRDAGGGPSVNGEAVST